MKSVTILVIAFVLMLPLTIFAQSSSQESNCPTGTKAVVKGANIECIKISNVKKTCPDGTYLGLYNQKNPACRDNITNQIVDPDTGLMYDSQTGEIILDDEQIMYVGIGIIVLIIIVAVITKASQSKTHSSSYKDVVRKHFTPNTKERVKELQHGKCADCGKYPTHWEFDHVDTRGDNSIENCQGLCLDCHQSKTRKDDWRNTKN